MSIVGAEARANRPPQPEEILKDVPLELFGGTCSEMESGDLPQGASAFNQDVDFELGAVFTRAMLTALFSGQVNGNVNYFKSVTLPNGNQQTLVLDSSGNFYYEDVTNNPGVLVLITNQIIAGSFAHSVAAFEREFITFHNHANGTDIPRQWDGVNFDRVSQDGPGAPPTVADDTTPQNLISLAEYSSAISSISEVGNICTVTPFTQTQLLGSTAENPIFDAGLVQPGDQISIPSCGVAGYIGTWTVLNVLQSNSPNIPFSYQFFNPTSGLNPSSSGTIDTGITVVNAPFDVATTTGGTLTFAGVTPAGYNGVWPIRWNPFPGQTVIVWVNVGSPGLANSSGSGTVLPGGNISAGVHKCAQAFLTRQGYITRFSPFTTWTAAGSLQAQVSNLAIGPANVVARILAFTAAGGAFFFYIPIPTVGSSTGTQINNNTFTLVQIDFSDATLLSATSVDSAGNNLFVIQTLEPCLGVNTYADRMAWWQELNAIPNFLNLSFDGGFLGAVPLGWTLGSSGSAGGAKSTTAVWGFSYAVTGNGADAIRGMITQGAAVDYLGAPVLLPSTQYQVRMRLRVSGAAAGSATVELFSPTAGSLGTFQVPMAAIPTNSFASFTGVIGTTPAAVPADLQLRYYVQGTLTNLMTVYVDEMAVFPSMQPTLGSVVRMSYADNQESYDGVTGFLGVDGLRGRPVTATTQLRDNFYITGDPGLFETVDIGTEPAFWDISTISQNVGCSSVEGIALGEEWFTMTSLKGEYIFNGNEPMKISQEIHPPKQVQLDWNLINPAAANTIWQVNDVANKQIFIGLPINGATLPNVVYMLNYREMNASWELAEQKPIHISYAGKMVAWDMSRKWSPWNIVANYCGIVTRQDGSKQTWFGNGLLTNKIYYLDPTNTTGDDGAFVNSIYFPFFFVNRDMEQMMQMGLGRKYYDYIRMFVAGSGVMATTAQSDSLTSPRVKALANRTLNSNPGYDTEIGVNWEGDRTTFGIQTAALGAWFRLSKMVVTMKQSAWIPKRGSV